MSPTRPRATLPSYSRTQGTGTVSEVERIREALRKTQGLMGALMLNAPVGIVLSHDRRITGYNPKFRDMFGFRGDEGVPPDGDPVYPPAESLLTTSADSAAIKRGSKAVAINDENLAVAFTTVFAGVPTTVMISPLLKAAPGDADPPFVKGWHSLTAAGFTVQLSAPAPAAASFHWLAIA